MHLRDFLSYFAWRTGTPDGDRTTTVEALDLSVADRIGSSLDGKRHTIVLDIDHPAMLFESTNGRYHLLIQKEVSAKNYRELLVLLARLGVINNGILTQFDVDGRTNVYCPWIRKTQGNSNE